MCWGSQVLGTAAHNDHNVPGCLAKILGAALISPWIQFSALNCDSLRKIPRYASEMVFDIWPRDTFYGPDEKNLQVF